MNKQLSGTLFTNAIQQVKNTKNTFTPTVSKSKLYSSNMDEEIDFAKESKKIGEQPNKLRSTIVHREKDFNPYKSPSNTKNTTISIIKKNSGGPKQILINKRVTKDNKLDKVVIKKENASWKHDLYVDEPNKNNYVVFVRNLPKYMTKTKLMDIFSKYGDIIGLNVLNIFIIDRKKFSRNIFFKKRLRHKSL